jgi:hypothetical protein
MWILIPDCEPCRSVLVSRASISPSTDGVELSRTSSGKPSAKPCSWRGWKRLAWTPLLFSRIYGSSAVARGVEQWISSLRGIHASPSPSRGSSSENGTDDISGRTYDGSSTNARHPSPSSRTSRDTFALGSPTCLPTLPRAGSMRNGVVSERPMLVRRTDENEYLSWPTAATTDATSSARHSTTTGVMHPGTSLTDAVRDWPTPTATPYGSSQNGICKTKPSGNTPNLENMARGVWASPNTAAANGFTRNEDKRRAQQAKQRKGHDGNELGRQAEQWATPIARDYRSDSTNCAFQGSPPLGRQALRTEVAGRDGSPKAALNPSFVEALMALPRGWTAPIVSARSETR